MPNMIFGLIFCITLCITLFVCILCVCIVSVIQIYQKEYRNNLQKEFDLKMKFLNEEHTKDMQLLLIKKGKIHA